MKVIAALLLVLISSCAAVEVDEKLLELAERWDVPQPHKDSKVVEICSRQGGDGRSTLGFVEPEHPQRALVGFRFMTDEYKSKVFKDFDGSLKGVESVDFFANVNGVNEGLITGIQLIRHGHKKVGMQLIEKSLKENAGHPHSPFYIRDNLPAAEALARSCLSATLNEITTEKPDFKRIKKKMEMLRIEPNRMTPKELLT